jgi:predicted RNase H-like nuclease (RuvC/YqgF family)
MSDEKILLKIKRQFSKEESVAELLRQNESLKIEIGVLKSEKSELEYEINKIRQEKVTEGTKTKKAWLKDDLIAEMTIQMKAQQDKLTTVNRQLNDWRNKYFSLVNKF